jgi:hypothetical protein
VTNDIPAEKSFLGVPIIGETGRGHEAEVEKHKKPADLAELIRPLLEDEFIVDLGWTQFTPYFNDGEACIFRARDFWVRTVRDADGEQAPAVCGRCGGDCPTCDDYDPDDRDRLRVSEYHEHPTLGGNRYGHNGYVGTQRDRYETASALAEALEDPAYRRALVDLFGDHCQVTVTREGIKVDGYVHHD